MDKVVSKKKLKKISWLFLLIFLIGCVFLGISYAYWQLTIKQKDFETLGVSCFEITLNDEQDDIKLESAYPISDEEGNNLVPYTFTITNTCDTYAYYQINLENLKEENDVKKLNETYIKASLDGNTPLLLTSYNQVAPTLEEAEKAYNLTSGVLAPTGAEGDKKTYELRLWMDYDTPPLEETMNAYFASKISVSASYIENEDIQNDITLSATSITEEINSQNETFVINATSKNYNLIEYSEDNNQWIKLDNPSKNVEIKINYTEEGVHTFYIKDEIGNIKQIEIQTTKLDKTPPMISINTNDYILNQENYITGLITDNQNISYAITKEGEEPTTWIDTLSTNYTLNEKITILQNLTVWAKDSLGNISSQSVAINALNNTTVEILTGNATVTINSTGENYTYIYYLDDQEVIQTNTNTYEFYISPGTHKIKTIVKDSYNNEATYEEEIQVEAIATMNDLEYSSLQRAFEEAPDNIETTVYLIKDTTENTEVSANKMINLSMGNNTLSSEEVAITNYGNITIEDGTIEATVNAMSNYNTVTIRGGILNATDENTIINQEGATLTVTEDAYLTNEAVTGKENTNYSVIQNNGEVTVSGGTITSETSFAIYNYNTVTITKGNLNSSSTNTIISQENATLTISGNNTTITGTATSYPTIVNYGNTEIQNGTITSEKNNAINNYHIATITGGTLNSNSGSTIYNQENATLTISGNNTTITETSESLPTIYNAGNIEIQDGMITSENSNVINNYNTVTITGGTLNSSGGNTIYNSENATLTITENAYLANEAVTGTGTTYYSVVYNYGNLNMNNGTIESTTSFGITNYGTAEITGGSITASAASTVSNKEGATLNISGDVMITNTDNSYTMSNYGTSNISGGTISTETYRAFYNSGTATITGGTISAMSYYTIYNVSTGLLNIKENAIITSNSSTALYNYQGQTEVVGGTITSGGSTLYNNEGTTTISGGTLNSTGSNTIYNSENATLTVTENAHLTNEGVTETGTTYYSVILNYGNLSMDNGTIESDTSFGIVNYKTTEITGGSITSSATNTVSNKENATLNISGDVMITNTDNSYTMANYGTANIAGGTIKTEINRAFYNSGTVTISGGTISTMAHYTIYNVSTGLLNIGGSAQITSNSAIVLYNYQGQIEISGGSVTSESGAILYNNEGTTTISGGVLHTSGGNTINNRVDSVVNIRGSAQITHSASSNYPAIYNYGSINIEGGTITSDNATSVYNDNGTVTMKNGTVTSPASRALYNSSGTMTIEGGAAKSETSSAIRNNETITISGGTFETGNYYAFYNSGSVTMSGNAIFINNSTSYATIYSTTTFTLPSTVTVRNDGGGSTTRIP